MYVSVLVVSSVETSGKPDFKIGLLRLNVDVSQQTPQRQYHTDKPAAGPETKVTYTVKTTISLASRSPRRSAGAGG